MCCESDCDVPESPDHLAQVFELVDQFQTIGIENVATFNDRAEDRQIEPCPNRDNDKDTACLEVIEKFQRKRTMSSGPVM